MGRRACGTGSGSIRTVGPTLSPGTWSGRPGSRRTRAGSRSPWRRGRRRIGSPSFSNTIRTRPTPGTSAPSTASSSHPISTRDAKGDWAASCFHLFCVRRRRICGLHQDYIPRSHIMSTRGTRSWRDVMPTYRSRWQQRNTMGTEKWEDAEPSYRYAYEMRSDPRYRGKSYRDAEGELRSDWERRHGDMPWDKAMYAVRDVFDGD